MRDPEQGLCWSPLAGHIQQTFPLKEGEEVEKGAQNLFEEGQGYMHRNWGEHIDSFSGAADQHIRLILRGRCVPGFTVCRVLTSRSWEDATSPPPKENPMNEKTYGLS